MEMTDASVSLEARVTLIRTRFVSAVALVGATVVDRVMAAALLRTQECPHAYFPTIEEARDWLKRQPTPQPLVHDILTRKIQRPAAPLARPGVH